MEFPNGFESWYETFYEVVAFIEETFDYYFDYNIELEGLNEVVAKRYQEHGTGGKYMLAREWTDAFEKENEGREWDGEFYDEIYEFVKKKNNEDN